MKTYSKSLNDVKINDAETMVCELENYARFLFNCENYQANELICTAINTIKFLLSERESIKNQEPSIIVKGHRVVAFNHADGTKTEGEFYSKPLISDLIINSKFMELKS